MLDHPKLSPNDVKPFTERSNLLGAWMVFVNWSMIFFAFALPILWWHPISLLVSLVLLANRQLGLSILMHECAHSSLFASKRLNQWVGHYLCAAPVLIDMDGYRKYHMQHHRQAGTIDDPDYPNYQPYPISGASFARKMMRDLSGITAIKLLFSSLLMHAGIVKYELSYKSNDEKTKLGGWQIVTNLCNHLGTTVIFHFLLGTGFVLMGYGWVYGLWWVSYFTFYPLFLRLRNAAEHGAVPDLLDKNPLRHARTTRANWLARLTVAPNFVNYHLEHHLKPSVPCYQLPKFHRYLVQRGLLAEVTIADGYISVISELLGANKKTSVT